MNIVEKPYTARIYKADQRGSEITAAHLCMYTFNYGNYQNNSREAFGALRFLNDECLAPGQEIRHIAEENGCVVVIPLVGSVLYKGRSLQEQPVAAEQAFSLDVKKGEAYSFRNPYPEETISYLHLGFLASSQANAVNGRLQSIGLTHTNRLLPFHADESFGIKGYIGIYEGRAEEAYVCQGQGTGVFAYVINGAFEVQGRLLEYRDGLSLQNTRVVAFEALSEHAIILVLEVPLQNN